MTELERLEKLIYAMDKMADVVGQLKKDVAELKKEQVELDQCQYQGPRHLTSELFSPWDQLIMKDVKVGDVIRHKSPGATKAFVITGHYGSRLTAVDTVDVTNEMEWEVFTKNK